MAKTISKIPSVPPAIVDAVNKKNLSIFVGAGVSKLVGCLGWSELSRHIVNKCFETKCINYRQRDRLSRDNNYKKTITICHALLTKSGFEDEFYDVLEQSLKGDTDLLKNQNIYQELAGIPALHITTNIDQHFDRFFLEDRTVYKIEDFDPEWIDQDKLYHIHGSIIDRSSIVFTVPQYINRYNNPTFKAFLSTTFDKYVVLFVGYGMDEFELLDFLISKFKPIARRELKHFILLPYYKGEEDALDFDSSYYGPMEIDAIGYEKDEKGYNQLYDVVKMWNDEIKQTSNALHEEAREIEEAVDNL
jgi:hypothetical protein